MREDECFIPHDECVMRGGDCFYKGKCLAECRPELEGQPQVVWIPAKRTVTRLPVFRHGNGTVWAQLDESIGLRFPVRPATPEEATRYRLDGPCNWVLE